MKRREIFDKIEANEAIPMSDIQKYAKSINVYFGEAWDKVILMVTDGMGWAAQVVKESEYYEALAEVLADIEDAEDRLHTEEITSLMSMHMDKYIQSL